MQPKTVSSAIAAAALMALLSAAPLASAEPPPPDTTRYVAAEKVNVRTAPTTKGKIRTSLKRGAEVKVFEVSGNWSRISAPGEPERWIYSSLLQPEQPRSAKDPKPDPAGPQANAKDRPQLKQPDQAPPLKTH